MSKSHCGMICSCWTGTQYFGITKLFQPLEQLLGQLLLPPLYKVHQKDAGVEIAPVFEADTTAAFGFTPVTYSPQNSALQVSLPQGQDVAFADDVGIKIEDFCYLGRQHFGK